MKSGVPRGTNLSPILFPIYVNDISDNLTSESSLYAYDTKVYREIKDTLRDSQALQSGLNTLDKWASTWQICFNPDECESMHITHKQNKSKPSYFLQKHLRAVESFQDLEMENEQEADSQTSMKIYYCHRRKNNFSAIQC